MKLFARIILFSIFLFFFIAFLGITAVFAEGEFQTDYSVTYTVTDIGKTLVNQDIVLKNRTANYYAEKFELKIGSTKVEDVQAQDSGGSMETSVNFEENITTISVKFNQKVIGQDKELPWKLSYASSELAAKSGQIWEVSIPRLAKSSDIGAYSAKVLAPVSLGPIAFAVPVPLSQAREGLNQSFTFDKDQLTQSGISMSFGEKQVFSFKLDYYIENTNLTARTEGITLPPDNNFQKVVFESINPPPADVDIDADGNFIAKYRLRPKQGQNVQVTGYVEVFSKPFRKITQSLTGEEKIKYLAPAKYWETDSAPIKEKAKNLKTPKQIFDFVSSYLVYNENKLNSSAIERLGALTAFNSPKEAVCMEFTDLFIAIARSAGIPAREIVGYAYTQNTRLRPLSFAAQGDLLHAWPEYWDDTLGWVQVDPTWASTSGGLDYFNKLDFNHITLVQRGLSSTNPSPAGAFKKIGADQKKDVDISFAQELPQITATPQLEFQVPNKIISGIPAKVRVTVKNIGSTSLLGGNLMLSASKLKVSSENPISLSLLPPFSNKEFTFNLESKSSLRKIQDTLVLSFMDAESAKNVEIIPFYYLVASPQFLLITSGVVLVVAAGLILYSRLHKLPRAKNPRYFL